jgi:MoxR-like ATPase
MEQQISVIGKIVENIEKVIVGKRETIELLSLSLMCEGHVLIEDVPGTGKTTLALALSKTIGGSLKRISCTPDIMPSDITGFSIFNPKLNEFEYREGAIMANVFLADEINRTPPKTQSGLLEAMEEKQVTVDGHIYPLPKPFIVIATQNPIEHLGTYPLPEAQLDRFLMKLSLGYPNETQELEILNTYGEKNPLLTLGSVTSLDEIIQVQEAILRVRVNEAVSKYIVNIVKESRVNKHVALGISPRGTLAIAKAAKAWAYYKGRDFVTPDDVKKVLVPVCGHRITPRAESKYENVTIDDILYDILRKVIVPS